MGVDVSDFVTCEGGLQEPLEISGKGDGVHELLEPGERGHAMWLDISLSYVVKDLVSNPDVIVVCVFLPGIVKPVKICSVLMQPVEGEENHEEFLY